MWSSLSSCADRVRKWGAQERAHVVDVLLEGVLLLGLRGLPMHHLSEDGVHILGREVVLAGLQDVAAGEETRMWLAG
jgi:hypothetical protein